MATEPHWHGNKGRNNYKPSFAHAKGFGMIQKDSGSHFDPAVVEAFCASEQEIKDVAARCFQGEQLEECEST